ncbi:thiamine pyrophosphokinase-related protein-like protein [Stipitochalara longipes BDJ]|nr:thiamine pyrophosphokinase-related protein-like protein [Stipitochalara longipes BDJ]
MKSNLDLVNECDSFPYPGTSAHTTLLSTFYTLLSPSGTPIGYLPESVFNALAKVPISIKGELEVNRPARTITCFTQATEKERSAAIAATCAYWRKNKTFEVLAGWRDEAYAVYDEGLEGGRVFDIERSASCLFGIVTYGVHMTCYTASPSSTHGIKIWVPRRAKTKSTYGGMLDNTVAGGMASGEEPFKCLVRESEEEASLPEELVKKKVQAKGTITYFHIREPRAGGESGLAQPECQYVYDLELPGDVVPKPNDSEVECFYLWTVEEIKEALGRGEFKPNCALLILDFFIRWGILNEENEPHYEEIKRRLHRELEFPGPHRSTES